MSRAIITPAKAPLHGTLTPPGDKSISHRRALMSLFVQEDVQLLNFGTGEDCQATLNCLTRLGKQVENGGADGVMILEGERVQTAELDCEDSGTTARLLMGILSSQQGSYVLRGDESLSRRPMERVAAPLRQMGAQIEMTNGCLPARITGTKLQGIAYESPVASAQVKSAVLLAALKAEGITRYKEPLPTRDHTERILGVVPDADGWIVLDPSKIDLSAKMLSASIPADASAAAFWVVAALMVPESRLLLRPVLANEHRISYVELLQRAGAQMMLMDEMREYGEKTATLAVRSSDMQPLHISGAMSAKVIDEIPVLAVLAAAYKGQSEFRDVGELRVKESDRLKLIAENLKRMGATVSEEKDALTVEGGGLHGAAIQTDGDHRIAMAFAISGLVARGETVIEDADCVRISYPEFWEHMQQLAPGSVRFER